MKELCANPRCEKNAVLFIMRRDPSKAQHHYCSVSCAASDSQRLSKLTPSDPMEESLREGRGGVSPAVSNGERMIEKEKRAIGNITIKLQQKDTGEIQRNLGETTMKVESATLPEFESETEFDQPSLVLNKSLTPRSEVSTPNLEEARSQSTNLLDESIRCMHGLMLSVKENIKEKNKKGEYYSVDPQQVNAAVNCARELANLMKVRLQVMKEMK